METKGLAGSVLYHVLWSKECRMEFKEYDFTRNPVAQNQAIFLESKCAPPTVCRPWCTQLDS